MRALTVPDRLLRPPLTRSELLWPIALAGYTQLDVWPTGTLNLGHLVGPAPMVSLLYAVTSLSLVWRRRAPLLVLAFVVTADALVYLSFGAPEGLGAVLPTLLAFYAVGRYAPTSALRYAAPLTLLGIALHELTDPAFVLDGLDVILWTVVMVAWPIGHAFRRRADEAEGLVAEARRLSEDRELMARAAVVDERARIARELHDVVGHGISVAVLQLVAADGLLDKDQLPAARDRLRHAERSARDALAEMRRLLGLIDADTASSLTPQPGLAQLGQLVDDTRSAGAQVDLSVDGDPVDLPAGLDLTAYRILQESLTNVLKHARPPRARVRLAYRPDCLVVEVHDQGRAVASPGTGGRGLAGMRERAALYGGELWAGPRTDGGYSLVARLPLDAVNR